MGPTEQNFAIQALNGSLEDGVKLCILSRPASVAALVGACQPIRARPLHAWEFDTLADAFAMWQEELALATA